MRDGKGTGVSDDFRDDSSESTAGGGTAASAGTGGAGDERSRRRAERRRRIQARSFDTSVASPCIAVCQLDANDVCIGCQRTMDEIRDWPILTADEKRAVLANVAARRDAT
jgi:predicted Fe-S protein YdhL (DUF1289 family)